MTDTATLRQRLAEAEQLSAFPPELIRINVAIAVFVAFLREQAVELRAATFERLADSIEAGDL